jgi:hypothetical protein
MNSPSIIIARMDTSIVVGASLHLWLYTFSANAGGRLCYEKNGFVPVRFGVSPAPESEPDVEHHWRPA